MCADAPTDSGSVQAKREEQTEFGFDGRIAPASSENLTRNSCPNAESKSDHGGERAMAILKETRRESDAERDQHRAAPYSQKRSAYRRYAAASGG